jgi:hypothetical protein
VTSEVLINNHASLYVPIKERKKLISRNMSHQKTWRKLQNDRRHLDKRIAHEEKRRVKQEYFANSLVETNVRSFENRLEYPKLPSSCDWNTQMNLYCPKHLLYELQEEPI